MSTVPESQKRAIRRNLQKERDRIAAENNAPWTCAGCAERVWKRDGRFTGCSCTRALIADGFEEVRSALLTDGV